MIIFDNYGIGYMNADYKKLWMILKERKLKKKDLLEMSGISSNIMAKMSKGELISMDSVKKICIALGCDVGDIVVVNKNAEKIKEKYICVAKIHFSC